MMQYESHQARWEKYATIRSRPRRLVKPDEKDNDFFPRSKQPLSVHPLVKKRGEDAIAFILAQTANRFMHDISVLETEMVNKGALMIAGNQFAFCDFPSALRHDALSIIIDEAYHAYVAIDYLTQIEDLLPFKFIPPPRETTVLKATNTVKALLPKEQQSAFELISVCIGEHVLTKELVTFKSETTVNKTFQLVMADHIFDEGRHATIFAQVLKYFWHTMPEAYQLNIGKLLPVFLKEYLNKTIDIEYNRRILQALDFTEDEIETIIADTFVQHCDGVISDNEPIVKNLINLLQRCLIVESHTIKDAFDRYKVAI